MNNYFTYKNNRLHAEQIDIQELAKEIGTPFYCYAYQALEDNYLTLQNTFNNLDVTICYAVKANPNIAVISTLAKLGAGADIVSQGELYRALKAGIPANKIIFSGVGKTADEINMALDKNILQFNVESLSELDLISHIALSKNKIAQIALRLNPDIDAGTHEKISTGKAVNKFGIAWEDAMMAFAKAKELPNINPRGIDVHIGSQIMDIVPFQRAFSKVKKLLITLRQENYQIDHLDLGGGLGVSYQQGVTPVSLDIYKNVIHDLFSDMSCRIFLEPGRLITANTGIIVSSVIRNKIGKKKNFIIIDAAMTELIRPTLYDAYHEISPITLSNPSEDTHKLWDIVGPVCETGDFLGKDRLLPIQEPGNLLVIHHCGAYAASLGSHYNTRIPAAEVMVKGNEIAVIRERPNYKEMISNESLPHWANK